MYVIHNSYTGQSPQTDAYATVTVARTCYLGRGGTNGTGQQSIDVSALSAGVYWLKATGDDSWMQTIKVMIVR